RGAMFLSRARSLLLVGALSVALPLGSGQAGGQEKELTPQERQQLESAARRLNKEAFAQYRKGEHRGAIRSLERALAVLQRLQGKRDRADLADGLSGLGLVLMELGQAGKALPYFERALAMRERLYPKRDHPDLARSLNNLGAVLQALGEAGKALPYL